MHLDMPYTLTQDRQIMTCGIYKLTFNNEYVYVGKSTNIEERWKQHFINLNKGTASESLQKAFNTYGHPDTNILKQCHPDHLGVLEPLYIHAYSNSLYCLNTNIPTISDENITPLILEIINDKYHPILQMSTLEHISKIAELETHVKEVEKDHDDLLELPEINEALGLEVQVSEMQVNIDKLSKALENEKNKSFWQKLFS
jgi:hypothetical protein